MAVERIEVRDNVLAEVRKLAEEIKIIKAGQEKLQADITKIKEDVKPKPM